MENKKQDVNSLEELLKVVNAYSDWFSNLADEISKVLADIQTSKKEKNTWEMKCPFKKGDKYWKLTIEGGVDSDKWDEHIVDKSRFTQGNIFPTEEAAELEAKRRNLLTRFRAFRDECNNGWQLDWKNAYENKYFICEVVSGLEVYVSSIGNSFVTFGYFKSKEDAERAIELFGDEIKELFVDCEG